jgi:hypothetical protein
MTSVPVPQLPPYRITLFYGPEPVDARPCCLCCVFNVKKRSWKGGVQVVVEVDEDQLCRARTAIGFTDWLASALDGMAGDERSDYERRAHDLFVQGLCALKLDLATEAGIPQENRRVGSETLVGELDRAVPGQAERIKSQILAELDLVE